MFQRKYKDEDTWHEVTEEEVRYRLEGYYLDLDTALDALRSGINLDTPFAIYRWIAS